MGERRREMSQGLIPRIRRAPAGKNCFGNDRNAKREQKFGRKSFRVPV